MKKLTGSIVALVTPFHEDGSVDFARLRELCDWHIANGTDAILALGTTGETASTSLEEDIKTLECVISVFLPRKHRIMYSISKSPFLLFVTMKVLNFFNYRMH